MNLLKFLFIINQGLAHLLQKLLIAVFCTLAIVLLWGVGSGGLARCLIDLATAMVGYGHSCYHII